MFKNSFEWYPVHRVTDVNGKVIPLGIDQIYSKEFQRGINGFPMSDITAAIQSQSLQEYEAILRTAQDMKATQPNYSDLSVEQIANLVYPKNLQTPSEVARASQLAASISNSFSLNDDSLDLNSNNSLQDDKTVQPQSTDSN